MSEPDGVGDNFLEVEEAELSSDDDVAGDSDGGEGAQAPAHIGGNAAAASEDSGTGSGGESSHSGTPRNDDDDHHNHSDEQEEEEYQIEEGESGAEFDEHGQDSGDEDDVVEEDDASDDQSADEDGAEDGDGQESGKDNGDGDSDSEAVTVRRRAPRRGGGTFKIPEEMRDNAGEFFRRSSRQSVAPTRFTAGDGSDSSDGAAEDDSDFDGEVAEDDASDGSYGTRKRTRRRQKAQTRRRQPRKSARNVEEDLVEPELDPGNSSSGSDGDWADAPGSRKRRARRKATRRARPASRVSEDDDDEVAHTIRINARTGGAVNYAEAGDEDSDIFNEDDVAVSRAARAAAANPDPNVPSIETICDYRVPDAYPNGSRMDDRESVRKMPLADFNPDTVEFYIKWTGKSFRRNTWHTLDELRYVKGCKRLTNFCKKTLDVRAELLHPRVTSEEWEDAAVLSSENRDALLEYTHIDRIIDERESKEDGDEVTEYLVKWRNLPYKDATWEPASALQSDEDLKAIDWYSDRLQSARAENAKRFNPSGREGRPKFRRMASQPGYLHGEGRTLREYQLAGLNWLAFSWSNNRNVILADEMGLGKTVQTVSLLGWIQYERNVPGPFLVVVPLSTIAAWVREFARWLPEMNVICYTGNGESRALCREREFEPVTGSKSRGTGVGFHCLLTTPELVMQDIEFMMPIRWAMIAIDEAHRLKNKDSELHRSLLELHSANRLLITGTPLQNSVGELWALLHFLNPEQFNNAEEFEESFSFSALRDEERVASLHSMLRPYIIRRQKADVEKSLPSKTYNVLRVGMTMYQQDLYRTLLTKNYAKLNMGAKGKGMGPRTTLNNLLVELKKCCNHPFLFDNVEDTSVDTTVDTLIRASGKLILLDKLLLRLRERGHRVLVFSQMVRMLDILSDYCRMRGFPHQRLDGSMPNDLRVRAVDHYNAPGSTDYVFLLSTRAGGLGINLATADTVIIFDSDWNPQNDLQAESRAHRIGQTKDVKVFRLLSRETVEEDILERAKRKRVLEHLVIHGVEGDEQSMDNKAKFNKQELSAILRFGAEKLFKEVAPSAEPAAAGGSGAPGGAGALDSVDEVKAEEKRVLEVDDIDELLARAPTEPEDALGAGEPSMGDSLLNAFKWADFDPIEEEGDAEGDANSTDADTLSKAAKEAARDIGSLDEKRKRDVSKAKAKQEREEAALAQEDDAEYWSRVIPDGEKSKAVAEQLGDDDVIVGRRKRKQTKSYGAADSPDSVSKRSSRRSQRSAKQKGVLEHGVLSRKEERQMFRSWRKYGDLARIRDILRDAGVDDRIDEEEARRLLYDCLVAARQKLRDTAKNLVADAGADADEEDGKAGKAGKPKSPPLATVDVLGEQVNARDLVRRCEHMELLGRKIAQMSTSDTQFRLRRQVKAPAYGAIKWKSKDDAMLLVGAHRHGLGNWTLIAEDVDLQLGDKVNVHGSTSAVKGAPDGTKLMRRATALLRELAEEEKLVAQKNARHPATSSRVDRKQKKKVVRTASGTRGKKRELVDTGQIVPPKGKKRAKVDKRDTPSSTKKLSRYSDQLKARQLKALKDLRKLSHPGSKLGKAEKVSKLKDSLYELGAEIVNLSGDNPTVRKNLWGFVHSKCSTASNGERLEALYSKVAAEREDRLNIGGPSSSIRP
jgi:chromodomain-helicase-DNA-binding protein 1